MRRLFLAALLAFPLLPAAAQDAPRGQAPVLELLPDTPRGSAADPLPGNAFVETQRTQRFRVQLGRAAARQVLRFRFVAVNTTVGNGIAIQEAEGPTDANGVLAPYFELPRDFPVGEYAIVLMRNGQEIATLPYFVRPTAPRNGPLTAQPIQIARRLENGNFGPIDQPRPQDRLLVFLTTLDGARTDGASVTWVLHAVETTGGAGEVVRNEERQIVENTQVSVRVTLPRDWWVGRYRIDLSVDGAPAGTREFRIAE